MDNLDSFAPILASDVKLKFLKEDERGRFYIAAKTKGAAYLRVHEAGKTIMEMFDGHTTLEQIDIALRSRDIEVDLHKFVQDLGEKGFIENYPRLGKPSKEAKLRVYNIPLFRNLEGLSRLAKATLPLSQKPWSTAFIVGNSITFAGFLVLALLGTVSLQQLLFLQNSLFLAFIVYILIIIPVLGLLHELAHAVVCHQVGGKPKEIGVAVYLFTFLFYTDTSDAWMLEKKKSIQVFLAGPLMTFFIGNACFLLCLILPAPFSQLSLMTAFAAYLSVLFGFDPLIESDGYYILQSLVTFPNLHSHAWKYVAAWIKRRIGMLSKEEYQEFVTCYSASERKVLKVYAPVAIVVNVLFVGVALPLGIMALDDYAKLTLTLLNSFSQSSMLLAFTWLVETLYISVGLAYSLWRIARLIATKIRSR
jgi:fumarate reductase subunit D